MYGHALIELAIHHGHLTADKNVSYTKPLSDLEPFRPYGGLSYLFLSQREYT